MVGGRNAAWEVSYVAFFFFAFSFWWWWDDGYAYVECADYADKVDVECSEYTDDARLQ